MSDKKIDINELKPLIKKYLSDQKSFVIILMLIIFAEIALQLVNPQVIRSFIDNILEGDKKDNLYKLAGIFIALSFMQQILNIAATYFSQNIGWKSTNRLRNDLAGHCMNLDMGFHKDHLPGELIERIDGDVTSLMNLFSNFMIKILGNILLLGGVLVALFIEDWLIGTSLTLFSIVSMIFLTKISTIAVPYWKKVRKISAEFYGFVGEHITNKEDVQSCGAKDYVFHKFLNFLRKWYPTEKIASILGYSMWTSSILVFAFGTAISFGVGGYLWHRGIITIGTVYLIFNYTELIRRPLEQIRMQLEDLQKAGAAIKRINEILGIKSNINFTGEGKLNGDPIKLEFQNVGFGYEENQKVIDNLTFNLGRGEILGLVGRTGSGKTTLGRLLLRLYDVKNGKILLDDKNIVDITKKSLRDHISVVTQDVELFNGTIRDNLTFYNRNIGDDKVMEAFGKLGIVEWLERLPKGLDTEIKSNNTGLSAGEAQLLSFVRIFLKNPGLIILDEASSRLDPATEALIERAVDNLLKNRTTIIIAHRLWTVQRADKIMILQDGEMLEFGDRVELAKDKSSTFSKLLEIGMEEVLA
ncbi:MAG: ABC transporter ATP-binding protein [Candidatus Delongbacteria bacterium]|nr:ABC transporter ATP-binding protein [Candidatus Delongbacteria bacterium]MBN2833368.1 ABC transporter ATP-binding protein [Candidatus Delongbacteria bacterium]